MYAPHCASRVLVFTFHCHGGVDHLLLQQTALILILFFCIKVMNEKKMEPSTNKSNHDLVNENFLVPCTKTKIYHSLLFNEKSFGTTTVASLLQQAAAVQPVAHLC